MIKGILKKVMLMCLAAFLAVVFSTGMLVRTTWAADGSHGSDSTRIYQKKKEKKTLEKKSLTKKRKHKKTTYYKTKKRRTVKRTYYPHYGGLVAKPPVGHRTLTVKGRSYYYHDGIYYWPGKSGHVVISGPVGARISVLPKGYKRVYVNRVPYYYYYGTYYHYDPGLRAYIVVDSPLGAEITMMPEGYETLYLGSTPYYYYHGTYYQYDPGRRYYRVVRAPVGLELSVLPYGYETMTVGSGRHYVYRGVHYVPHRRNGVTVYKVVRY